MQGSTVFKILVHVQETIINRIKEQLLLLMQMSLVILIFSVLSNFKFHLSVFLNGHVKTKVYLIIFTCKQKLMVNLRLSASSAIHFLSGSKKINSNFLTHLKVRHTIVLTFLESL